MNVTYTQYVDYANIRNAISTYNNTYGKALIELETPEGTVSIPALSVNKAVIDTEQLRKDYPTYTDITIAGECLIKPLPSINTILQLSEDIFKERVSYIKDHTNLDYSMLTQSKFHYLISGDPSVLRPNN